MGFRIESVRFKNRAMFGAVEELSHITNETDSNYYTLIIGNNGCGKTTLMNAMANYYCGTKARYSPFTDIVTNGVNPDKVIVTTNGISDTFPNDLSSTLPYKSLRYVYLGTRFYGNYSKRYLLERTAILFLDSEKNEEILRVNQEILQFIGYGNVVNIKYNLHKDFNVKGNFLKKKLDGLKIKYNATDHEAVEVDGTVVVVFDVEKVTVGGGDALHDGADRFGLSILCSALLY